MSQLRMILQESVAAGGGGGGQESRTILAFLMQQMDGVDHHDGRRSSTRLSFKERLGLKGLGCCGTAWAFRAPTTVDDHDDEGEGEEDMVEIMNLDHRPDPSERDPDPGCLSPVTAATRGMNMAAALAAERQFRTDASSYNSRVGSPRGGLISAPGTPMRVSLMRLIEETDGRDVEMEKVGTESSGNGCGGVGGGSDTVCCVCMVRKKGAAFIPCGHTFCRVCSREVWLNRGSCPLCNRSILEILDIF